jgi:dynein heavy chain|tara:strand:- start:448 stop:1566 length:1119 start_codon:yes stop_codon:yes gene_type:complete
MDEPATQVQMVWTISRSGEYSPGFVKLAPGDGASGGVPFIRFIARASLRSFDEFNRIKIEVISVVAMQVLSIVNALSQHAETFNFMGSSIRCNVNCGLFITMNPGYAGRTELPDNLKALMRPVAMMVPDLAMIAEVMLSAEGFTDARVLSKKTITLYSLMQQQLSKQDHYDYGLRNLKAVLNMAGSIKRADPSTNEEAILMRALRDMNLPKFIKDDERLFRLLLGDLFPSLELPVSEIGDLSAALEAELKSEGLQTHPFLLFKIGQLYDSKLTRHCNMLVGATLSGKSTAWKTLAKAKTSLAKSGTDGYVPVTSFVINPKSITLTELYGAYDLTTFEWADGILSTIFKSCAESDKPDEKWVLFGECCYYLPR